jgi:hypothetical protein
VNGRFGVRSVLPKRAQSPLSPLRTLCLA